MKKKLFIALTIILIGGGVSVLVVQGQGSSNASPKVVSPDDFVANLLDYQSGQPEINSSSSVDYKEVNLTDAMAKILAKGIAKNNPQGIQQTSEGIKINASDLTSADINLTEEQRRFLQNGGISIQTATESDIKVGSNNSPERKIDYMKEVSRITNESYGGFDKNDMEILDELFEKQNTASARRFANIASKHVDGLSQVKVPSDFMEMHLDLINGWKKKAALYSALGNYRNDPLKASAALGIIHDTVKEVLGVQKKYIQEYLELKKTLGLTPKEKERLRKLLKEG